MTQVFLCSSEDTKPHAMEYDYFYSRVCRLSNDNILEGEMRLNAA